MITPYEGQRAYVTNHLATSGSLRADAYEEIEVASVDAFQGREKDVIVLSCVRSNEHQGIGFLSDPRRLNVALTRARYGLIILGNARVLAQDPLWHALLTHLQDRGCLAEGSLANLKPSVVPLPRPKRGGAATEARLRRTALGRDEGHFARAAGDRRGDHWGGYAPRPEYDPDYDRGRVARRREPDDGRAPQRRGDGYYGAPDSAYTAAAREIFSTSPRTRSQRLRRGSTAAGYSLWRRRNPSLRSIRVAATPRCVSADDPRRGCGDAAMRLRGRSASRLRRRRDLSPLTMQLAAAASP